jgi:hypothetical protein
MKALSIICITLFPVLFASCPASTNKIANGNTGTNDSAAKKDTAVVVQNNVSHDVEKYNGTWFSISYPGDFTASPTGPTGSTSDYTFVETDEAKFISPDGEVEFFVYSPQWGGDPASYLNTAANEKMISEKADSTDKASGITRWITFTDVSGKYTRSVTSIKTESTHLVFGIKYKDAKAYDKYKDAYTAFKKSLVQYAD